MRIGIDLPPGLASNDTSFAASGRYNAMSGVGGAGKVVIVLVRVG